MNTLESLESYYDEMRTQRDLVTCERDMLIDATKAFLHALHTKPVNQTTKITNALKRMRQVLASIEGKGNK